MNPRFRRHRALAAVLAVGAVVPVLAFGAAADASTPATTTVVTSSALPATVGESVTFTATIYTAPGAPVAVGSGGAVVFSFSPAVVAPTSCNGQAAGDYTVDTTSSTASCSVTIPAPPSGHNLNLAVNAAFGGTSGYLASTSGDYDQLVWGGFAALGTCTTLSACKALGASTVGSQVIITQQTQLSNGDSLLEGTDEWGTTYLTRWYPDDISIDRAEGSDTTVFMMQKLADLYTTAGLYGCSLDATNDACLAASPSSASPYNTPDALTTDAADNYPRTEELEGIDAVGSGDGQDMLCGGINGQPLPYSLSRNNPSSTTIAETYITSALTSGTSYTSLSVDALQTTNWAATDTLELEAVIGGVVTTQTLTLATTPAAGATSISVNSFTANASYAANTLLIDLKQTQGPGPLLDYSRSSKPPSACPQLVGMGYALDEVPAVVFNTVDPGALGNNLINCPPSFASEQYSGGSVVTDPTGTNDAAAQGTNVCATQAGFVAPTASNPYGEVPLGPLQNGWLPGDALDCYSTSTGCSGWPLIDIDDNATSGDPANGGSYPVSLSSEPEAGVSSVAYRLWCDNNATSGPGGISDWGQLTNLGTSQSGTPLANPGDGVPIGVPVNIIGVNTSSGTYSTWQTYAASGIGTASGECSSLNNNTKVDPTTSDQEIDIENNAAQIGVTATSDCTENNDLALTSDADDPSWAGQPAAANSAGCEAEELDTAIYFMSYGVYFTNHYAAEAQDPIPSAGSPSGGTKYPVLPLAANNVAAGYPSICTPYAVASAGCVSYPTQRELYNVYIASQVRASTADFLNWVCQENGTASGQFTKGVDLNTGVDYDNEVSNTIGTQYGFVRIPCGVSSSNAVPASSFNTGGPITQVADPNS